MVSLNNSKLFFQGLFYLAPFIILFSFFIIMLILLMENENIYPDLNFLTAPLMLKNLPINVNKKTIFKRKYLKC